MNLKQLIWWAPRIFWVENSMIQKMALYLCPVMFINHQTFSFFIRFNVNHLIFLWLCCRIFWTYLIVFRLFVSTISGGDENVCQSPEIKIDRWINEWSPNKILVFSPSVYNTLLCHPFYKSTTLTSCQQICGDKF